MKCPVCKAENVQGPQCRRCRADLSSLFTLEGRRRQALAEARLLATQGQWQRALAVAEGADAMHSDQESRRLLAVVHLLRRDFTLALSHHRSIRSSGT